MANKKIKAEVRVDQEGGGDIDLVLTDAQARVILDGVLSNEAVYINLVTASGNGKVKDNPEAYAQ